MTKIYKFQDDISTEASKELQKCTSLAIDPEGSGLQIPHRDKLSLIQICDEKGNVYIIQPNKKTYKAPNLVSVLENEKVLKTLFNLELVTKNKDNSSIKKIDKAFILAPK